MRLSDLLHDIYAFVDVRLIIGGQKRVVAQAFWIKGININKTARLSFFPLRKYAREGEDNMLLFFFIVIAVKHLAGALAYKTRYFV